MTKKLTAAMLLLAAVLSAATCDETKTCVSLPFNLGTTNTQYICDAPPVVAETSVSVAGGTMTSIAVSSNVGTVTIAGGHNLYPGAVVHVSGSSTSALNGTYYVVTVPNTTTYTITTSGVDDATYTTGLVIKTNSPLTNASVWRVTVIHYTSGSYDGMYPGGGSLSTAWRAKCSDRASY